MRAIRREQPADAVAIHTIHEQAFGQPAEAVLVDRLRAHCTDYQGFVLTQDQKIIGHLLFTPVELTADNGCTLTGMGLAPLAVLPAYQRQGYGSALIETGLLEMQTAGWPYVVVLGHPDYYPRFGFAPASHAGLRCEYAVPEEAFMLLVFDEDALHGIKGTVRYRPEFASL